MTRQRIRLTPHDEAFCQAVLRERTPAAAYLSVYGAPEGGLTRSPGWAHRMAGNKLARANIAARIKELREQLGREVVIEMAEVIREWLDIARADPNELISHQRRACRHCWGYGHEYQWLHEREFAEALADAIDHNAMRKMRRQTERELPDRHGGMGFDCTKPPAVNCPHCHGEGVPHVHVADTTKLTGPAAKLYAGIKVGKDGKIEVLMRNQDMALQCIAKALGMFADKAPKDPGAGLDLNELQKLLPN